jgi:hypothetical protein
MNPFYSRVAILVTELMVFFAVTVLMTNFISYASAPQLAAGAAPPADFPVIAYTGSRERPDPGGYVVVTWSQWEGIAARRPGASLLLPERSGTLQIGDDTASFTVTDSGASRQTVDLVWRAGNEERRARYTTEGRGAEPQDFRTIGAKTLILGGLGGFAAGMLIGQLLRRRLPLRPA